MKEKIKHLLKADLLTPETALLVSFLTPVVAYGIMFMMRGIFPFGDRMILGSDLKEQYAPFSGRIPGPADPWEKPAFQLESGAGHEFLVDYRLLSGKSMEFIICAGSTKVSGGIYDSSDRVKNRIKQSEHDLVSAKTQPYP